MSFLTRQHKAPRRRLPGAGGPRRLPDLRDVHARSSPTTTRSRSRRPRSASSCPSRADVKIRGVLVGEVLDDGRRRRRRRADPGPVPEPGRHDPRQRHRLDRAQDPVRREVRLPHRPRRRRRARRSRPAPRSSAPWSPPRSRRCSPTSTRCCARSQPAELNMTLNALATALEGRGDEIGQNLETVDSYLKRLNPQIPALVEDLRLTASVSDTYADVLPQVGDILHNTVTTTGTLETREARLHAAPRRRHRVLRDRAHLPRRQRRQPDPARRGQPGPAAGAGALLDRVPVPARRHRQRRQARRPRRSAASRSTSCSRRCRTSRAATPPPTSRGSARTAARPACTCPTRPGTRPTRSAASPTSTTASTPRSARAPPRAAASYAGAGSQLGGFGGYAGSPEESDLLADLLAPTLGTTADQVPDLGGLLLGPMVRGATVSLGDDPRRGCDAVKLLDKRTTCDLTKLLIFIVVTTLATGVLVVTIGNLSFSGARTVQGRLRRRHRRQRRATTSGSPA